jgi:hypothetical protein
MSIHLLSNELPRSRRLSVALVLIVLLLALAPFLLARALSMRRPPSASSWC